MKGIRFTNIKPSKDPEEILAIFNKGFCYFENKKYQDAINCFNSIIDYSLNPLTERILYLRGISYAKIFKFEEASKDCVALNSPEISHPFKYIHLMRGMIADQELSYLDSLHSFKRAIKYDSEVIKEEKFLLKHLSQNMIEILNKANIVLTQKISNH